MAIRAAAEFPRFTDHLGIVVNLVLLGALAHFQSAEPTRHLATQQNQRVRSFLTLWKDPDIPILKEAKVEYEKLK